MRGILSLPDELLLMILCFALAASGPRRRSLSRIERKECSLVCRRWYRLLYNLQWEDISFAIIPHGQIPPWLADRQLPSALPTDITVNNYSHIWDFFECDWSRKLGALVRSLHLVAHAWPPVQHMVRSEVMPSDFLRIFMCFPNVKKLSLTNTLRKNRSGWAQLELPALDELRSGLWSYASDSFEQQELDMILFPLQLFQDVKRVILFVYDTFPRGIPTTRGRHIACNPQSLCIQGVQLYEVLQELLVSDYMAPDRHTRLRSLEIGPLMVNEWNWLMGPGDDGRRSTFPLASKLLEHVGSGLQSLGLCLGSMNLFR